MNKFDQSEFFSTRNHFLICHSIGSLDRRMVLSNNRLYLKNIVVDSSIQFETGMHKKSKPVAFPRNTNLWDSHRTRRRSSDTETWRHSLGPRVWIFYDVTYIKSDENEWVELFINDIIIILTANFKLDIILLFKTWLGYNKLPKWFKLFYCT